MVIPKDIFNLITEWKDTTLLLLQLYVKIGDKYCSRFIIDNIIVIFAESQIFGSLHFGDNSVFRTNTVVLTSVSYNSIIAEIPTINR